MPCWSGAKVFTAFWFEEFLVAFKLGVAEVLVAPFGVGLFDEKFCWFCLEILEKRSVKKSGELGLFGSSFGSF